MQPLKHQNDTSKLDHKISQRFRTEGVAEEPKKAKAENLLPRTQKVNEVLNFSAERPSIVDLKRLGKFDEKTVKLRSLLTTSASEHEARLVLAKSKEKPEALSEIGICLLAAFLKDDAINKNLNLKNRRDPLNDGLAGE